MKKIINELLVNSAKNEKKNKIKRGKTQFNAIRNAKEKITGTTAIQKMISNYCTLKT